MAKVKNARSSARNGFEERLIKALKADLRAAGVSVKSVTAEPVRGTKLHRAMVVAKGFDELGFTERQDLIWRIISRHFTPEEQLQISTVYAFSPDEARGL